MESNNSFSFFPLLQDDELQITSPGITIWNFGVENTTPHPPAEIIDLGDTSKGKLPNKMEGNEGGRTQNHQEMKKKMMHRDIERQRRQEMASLHAALRSVLPPQQVKGKRSVSDQIHEAEKYIRHLQSNLKKLGIKRDSLKGLHKTNNEPSLDYHENGSSSSRKISPVFVTVQPCSVGVEVLISGDFMVEGHNFSLARILHLLLEEGLVVVCCNCTKFDGRLHYVIQSEVLDHPGVDLQMLQSKLTSMIINSHDR